MTLKDFNEIDFPLESNFESNIDIIYHQLKAIKYIVDYVYFERLLDSKFNVDFIKEHRSFLKIESKRVAGYLEFIILLKSKKLSFTSFEIQDYFNHFYTTYHLQSLERMKEEVFDMAKIDVALTNSNLRIELENRLDTFIISMEKNCI